MSNRTFGVVKRLLMVVGVVLYAFVATRTTAYWLLTNAQPSIKITWWNLPPIEPFLWFKAAFLAAALTVVLIISMIGFSIAITALMEPLEEEVLKDGLKAAIPPTKEISNNAEPDIVEVAPLPAGEYSQPPIPQTPLTYAEALEDRLNAATPRARQPH